MYMFIFPRLTCCGYLKQTHGAVINNINHCEIDNVSQCNVTNCMIQIIVWKFREVENQRGLLLSEKTIHREGRTSVDEFRFV